MALAPAITGMDVVSAASAIVIAAFPPTRVVPATVDADDSTRFSTTLVIVLIVTPVVPIDT
jgi:hypothetical protein